MTSEAIGALLDRVIMSITDPSRASTPTQGPSTTPLPTFPRRLRKYVFSDEAGNFDFRDKHGASRYFILTTVTTVDSPQVGDDLLALRRGLAWDGIALESNFHAAGTPWLSTIMRWTRM